MTRQKIHINFVENLEKERCAAGLTQCQMAEKLDMSVSGYKKLISGETTKIDLYTAYRLCTFTGKWLFEFCEGTADTMLKSIALRLRYLSPYQLCFLSSVIDFEMDYVDNYKHDSRGDYINLLTPTGSHHDGMIWDSTNIEKINISHYRKRFGSMLHCAIRITGNYLHPTYNAGDILLVSQTALKDGDTGLFVNKDENRAYIRKFKQTNSWILEPVNGYGQTFVVDNLDKDEMDKWIIFGRVLTKVRVLE